MYKEFSGIDEAALGPILGPYCCTAVSFVVKENIELFEIFSKLNNIKISDSKKLYTSGKSIKELENTALTFASVYSDSTPRNILELIEVLLSDSDHLEHLNKIPWFKNIKNITLPVSCDHETISQNTRLLQSFLWNNELEIKKISADIVPAISFNKILNKGLNKSETCQQVLSPLIKQSLREKSRVVVDRQGGRRYYGEWLLELFPKSNISIERETKDLSSYDINGSQVRFQVKGDDKYLETALASIFSKYLRELLMLSFNQYWQEKAPGIKKTAGYPQDGKRFIIDLENMNIDFDKEMLIRQK